VVSRLSWQKGFDFAVPALRELLATEDAQFIVLGTGAPEIERQIAALCRDFPGKAVAYLHFDAALSQHIYAGSDLFLMPSHFEPCGIGQMIAMRYGALPLVRETGGLADTVANYDNGAADVGTGFVFQEESSEALLGTMRWALQTYRLQPKAWVRMQERAMRTDFSWDLSARHYVKLFGRATLKSKEGDR
jgi:starch synthase